LTAQLHDSLQIDDTSLTHWLSQLVLQQNPSWAQISVAQLSHVAVSLLPVEQIACAQVPPPHDWWQIEATSPTQTESHVPFALQQNASAAQTWLAQVSHDAVR